MPATKNMFKNLKKDFKDRDKQFYAVWFIVLFGVAIWMDSSGLHKLQTNTWYYSLSTIIQSLAAILAIGGSFFVFRINQVNNEVGEYRKRMINFLGKTENNKTSDYHGLSNNNVRSRFSDALKSFVPSPELTDFFIRYEKLPISGDAQKEVLENWLTLFENNVNKADQIIKFLGISVKITASTIIGCAIILFLTEIILSWQFLALSVWAFLISTYYMANAILNITKP